MYTSQLIAYIKLFDLNRALAVEAVHHETRPLWEEVLLLDTEVKRLTHLSYPDMATDCIVLPLIKLQLSLPMEKNMQLPRTRS